MQLGLRNDDDDDTLSLGPEALVVMTMTCKQSFLCSHHVQSGNYNDTVCFFLVKLKACAKLSFFQLTAQEDIDRRRVDDFSSGVSYYLGSFNYLYFSKCSMKIHFSTTVDPTIIVASIHF